MANKVRLQVLTPERAVLDEEVDYVLLRTLEGDMGILHGHASSAVQLEAGVLRAYVDKNQVLILAVMSGFAMVQNNTVAVMTDVAEAPENIEAALARREGERAENRHREETSDLEMHRAESALRRMLVQMDVSSYSIIRGNEEKHDHKE